MIYVKVRKGQSIDRALGILKKKVKESKLMLELREREFYKKPSAIRKEKKSKARLRNKKDTNNYVIFLNFIYLYIYKNTLRHFSHLVV